MKNILNVIRFRHKRQSNVNELRLTTGVPYTCWSAISLSDWILTRGGSGQSGTYDEISGSLGRSLSMTTAMGVYIIQCSMTSGINNHI